MSDIGRARVHGSRKIGGMVVMAVACLQGVVAAESIDEIFLAQRQNFSRLRSIDMVYSEDWEPGEYVKENSDRPLFRAPRHLVFGFQKEGEKFRVDSAMEGTKVSAAQEPFTVSSIVAFDLNKYQRYDKRDLYLRVQSREINPLVETNCPLIVPYRHLFAYSGNRNLSFSSVESEEAWDALRPYVRVGEVVNFEDHECIVMDVSFPGGVYSGQVYWARDLGYYPVRFRVLDRDEKALIDTTVKDVKRQDTAEGPVFVPVRIEQTQWHATGGHMLFALTHQIETESLSVNEDIPDDVFTIPLHMVQSYEDVDEPNDYFSTEDVIAQSVADIDGLPRASGSASRPDGEGAVDANALSTDENARSHEMAEPGGPDEATPGGEEELPRRWMYAGAGVAVLGVLALLVAMRHCRVHQ